MIKIRLSLLVFISLLLAANAGLSIAHDTGTPHTHDPASKGCALSSDSAGSIAPGTDGFHAHLSESTPTNSMTMAFLVIPIGGEFLPFHWLWHYMNGQASDGLSPLTHEFMHWHGLQHSHEASVNEVESNQSAALAQYD